MVVYGRDKSYPSPWVPESQNFADIYTPYEIMNMDYSYEAILHMDFNILSARGETFQFWREKKSGHRCDNPLCPASKDNRNQPNPNCPTCLGTGFINGYDLVGEILLSVAAHLDQVTYEIGGQMYFWKPQTWTMPDPRIYTGDLLFALDQDKILQTKMIQDEVIVRRTDYSADFDQLNSTSVTRIVKIADAANSSETYQKDADYVISNNGVLWISTHRPDDFAEYFVTYEITDSYHQLFQVVSTTFATVRGKPLRQIVEMTALGRGHYLYENLRVQDPYESYNYPYAFPYSEFFDRS